MAKKDATLNVGIDDNGDLKKLERDAKKTGKALDKGAKGAHSMDRRVRGAAQMSSSATKNFSKMSQGISGGLVPAYATLAASLFAVDAAFRALKRASDLRVQQEGMEAYSASTGIALKSIARDLQAATGYQLDFKEAAESTSIAISAGFSADQVTAIGKAAKMASIALGRDFADSYQRLLKGITKAEPELLDELGIILRLEKATKVYGAQIGKNAKDLTAYERQQAVFNEVMDQTAKKYAAVGDAIPVSVMGQLGAQFTDLTDSFLKGIAPIAEFFGNVLVNSTTAAIAALGVFAASILKNVIPPLDVMITKAGTAWGAMTQAGRAAGASFMGIGKEFKRAGAVMTGTPAKGLTGAGAVAGKLPKVKGAGMESLRAGGGLSPRQLAGLRKSLKHAQMQWKKHGEIISGNWKGVNIKMVNSMQTSLTMMQGSTTKFVAATKIGFKSLWTTAKLSFTMIGAMWKATASAMRVVATTLGAAMNKALGIIGWIGMLFMAKDIFKDIGNMWDKILISIGNAMQKIGQWIQKIASYLGPLGWIMGGIGKGLEAGGERITARGIAMQPEMKRKRAVAAAGAKAADLHTSMTQGTADIKEMKMGWKGMSDDFDQTAAEINMMATAGGLGNLQKHIAMTKEETGLYTEAQEDGVSVLHKGKLAMIAHYKELGKTDKRYAAVAVEISHVDTDWKKVRDTVVDLTNEYGSHAQALKDMESAEEGRAKRLAELAIKAQRLTKGGLEVRALAKSVLALTDNVEKFSAGTALKSFYDFFGTEEAKKITTKADALKYVNAELKKYQDLVAGIIATTSGVSAGALELAGFTGAPGLMKQRAQEIQALNISRQTQAQDEAKRMDEQASLRRQLAGTETDEEGAVIPGLVGQEKINAEAEIKNHENFIKAGQEKLAILEQMDTSLGQIKLTAADAFVNGMQKGLEGLVTGTMSVKEAFSSMAKSMLVDIGKMIVKQMMLNMLMGSKLGNFLNMAPAAPVRYGGILSSPGYRSFQGGGIATGNSGPGYLAKLHGTEAVVPLGNDRSIPVKMQGRAGNTNVSNVTVNVAEGGTTSEIQGTTGAAMFGKVIATAIEERLQDEQRPGGILYKPGGG